MAIIASSARRAKGRTRTAAPTRYRRHCRQEPRHVRHSPARPQGNISGVILPDQADDARNKPEHGQAAKDDRLYSAKGERTSAPEHVRACRPALLSAAEADDRKHRSRAWALPVMLARQRGKGRAAKGRSATQAGQGIGDGARSRPWLASATTFSPPADQAMHERQSEHRREIWHRLRPYRRQGRAAEIQRPRAKPPQQRR